MTSEPALLWRRFPGGSPCQAVISVPYSHAWRIKARGWLKINGQRATPQRIDDFEDKAGRVALVIVFDEPYPYPHP